MPDETEKPPLLIRQLDPEEADRRLRERLPEIEARRRELEEAQKIPPGFLDKEITI